MSYFQLALKEDLAHNYKEAIELYSKSVEDEELILDAHLNLTVILFNLCHDIGLSSYLINNKKFNEIEIARLCEYMNFLIKKTVVMFSKSNEAIFWKYFKENYYTGYSNGELREIIMQDEKNLVPYFQLYIAELANRNDVSGYKEIISKLKSDLIKNKTIKNEYILSLIESAEHQNRIDLQGML